MEQLSYYTNLTSFVLIILLWVVFAGTFLLRKRPPASPDKVGVPSSFLGVALQGLSFGIVWAVRRSPLFSPFADDLYTLNIAFQVLAVLIAGTSVWLTITAVRELGRQWSLKARLIEGHKLVNTGVYGIVRHPIYTAMLGKLIATGIVYSHWIALICAVLLFLIGTRIRTNIEEKLLGEAFGDEFRDWKRKVPGLVPFLKF
jgi:protein-S-isoprenylcysteine O-methyltransferase Ste14